MICCRNNQAVAVVLLEKLQKRIQHAPNLANILAFASTRADGIEFVKEVDAPRRLHCIKNKPQLSGSLSHELGDQTIEDDREKGQMKLPGQCRCGHRLA